MSRYAQISHKLFGGFVKFSREYFLDMRNDLQKANMVYTLDEYLSIIFSTTILTFMIECIILAFIFGIMKIGIIVSVLMAFTLSLSVSGILFFLFYSYPTTLAKTRTHKIKKILPFVVSYLATISSSKTPPTNLFKTISKFKEYGEIADESNNIVRDVEMFGMTFSAAIKKQAKRTPSNDFRELLLGMNTVVASGGDLTLFLKQKNDEFMGDYMRRIRKYAQDLSLYTEIYLTLIITGSIFFIVLSSIISAISGGLGTVLVQSFVVFILLPLMSIGFLMIIKSISPTE